MMADPLSVASGVAGLISLTIQATQLTCKYVAEVSHAGENALQCLRSLSRLRDVMEKFQETEEDVQIGAILKRKSELIAAEEIEVCTQSVEKICVELSAMFRGDGTIKKRKALFWPFHSADSANLIKQLQDFRDTFASKVAIDSLSISAKTQIVLNATNDDVHSMKTNLESEQQQRSFQALLNWLLPGDHETWRLRTHEATASTTSDWFFGSSEFATWLSAKEGILWCHGVPGSGKSVLSSQAVAEIQKRSSTPDALVLSHFCDHRDAQSQSSEYIVRHLLRQAAQKDNTVLQALMFSPTYTESQRNRRSIRPADARQMLLHTCLSDQRFTVVIDGLDECMEELDNVPVRHDVLTLLETISSSGTKMFVASRRLADIDTVFGQRKEVTVRAPDASLKNYVETRLAGLERKVPQAKSLITAITDKIVADVDGVYLLARLMVDMLAPAHIKNIRQIRKFLAESSWDLSQMYRETLTRITSSDPTSAELARSMLLWLCHTQRPLHETELQHALAIEPEDDDFDPDGITPGDLLLDLCMGLAVRDDHGMYSLFHKTAYDFFRQSPAMSADHAHLLITRTCINYLSFPSTGQQGPCGDLAALEKRRAKFGLLDYAAKNWARHAKQVEDAVVERVVSFLRDVTIRRSLVQLSYHRERKDEDMQRLMFDSLPTGLSALQIACGSDICHADDQGWTALIAAASYGHVDVARLLISKFSTSQGDHYSKPAEPSALRDSDDGKTSDGPEDCNGEAHGIDQPDREGWTPLVWSVIKGQYNVAQTLVASGARVTRKDRAGWSPIHWAAFSADVGLVRLLLQSVPNSRRTAASTRMSLRGSYGLHFYKPDEFTPIFLAAAAGDDESVKAMLDFGTQERDGAYHAVARLQGVMSKAERINSQSLPHVTTPSFVNSHKFTVKLFEAAIQSDQLTIVKMLFDLGASLGPMDEERRGRSPLHIAACCNNYRICQYLLDQGASPSAKDAYGMYTPLDLALFAGSTTCAKLLLTASAESKLINDGDAVPAFVYGLCHGPARRRSLRQEQLSKLQDPPRSWATIQTSLNLFDADGLGESLAPSKSEREVDDESLDILNTILDHGCDINAYQPSHSSYERQTALSYACGAADVKMIHYLLDKGADIHRSTGGTGETALLVACGAARSSTELIQTLIDRGADVNASATYGASPLMEACRQAPSAVVRLLVASGAHLDTLDHRGRHALHYACQRELDVPRIAADTVNVVEYILESSEPEVLSIKQKVSGMEPLGPLDLAIRAKNWYSAMLLHSHGARIGSMDFARSCLWNCCYDMSGRGFQFLLDQGVELTGYVNGFAIIPKYLWEYYLDHRRRKDRGDHDSFRNDVGRLIELGADVNARIEQGGWKGLNALQVAKKEGTDEAIVQILVQYGADETHGTLRNGEHEDENVSIELVEELSRGLN